MKTIFPLNILDQKRFSTHLALFVLTLLALGVAILFQPARFEFSHTLEFLILGFIQVEAFILLAGFFFRDLKTASTRQEMTRIILSRFALFITGCFIAALIIMILFLIITGTIRGTGITEMLRNFFTNSFSGWLRSTLTGLSVGAVLFLFFQWQDALNREQRLREQNLVFQNETLKNQVNPHFLFNSLNTVSSLIQSDPAQADEFVRNLSSVYRYIIENVKKDLVPVQTELDFVSAYFALHEIRDEEKMKLTVKIDDANGYKILPVSLQILIENAIKHNMATREKPLEISICQEGQKVAVKNNLQRKASAFKSTGTGLANLAERVRLITGKELIVKEMDNYFEVEIPLLK
jgi:sensor histidine kinase YesM